MEKFLDNFFASKSAAVELKEKSSAPDNILDCTICLEVSASPIYNCKNGHIICGICQEKLTTGRCGICRDSKLTVSIFAERLAKQYEIVVKCPNFQSGCSLFKSTEIKSHLEICLYRPVVCNNTNELICEEASVPLDEYGTHLINNHGMGKLRNGNIYSFPFAAEGLNRDIPNVVINFDNRDFVWRVVEHSSIVYWWVTILGGKKDAQKYYVESELVSIPADNSLFMKTQCRWQTPVFPYHEHSKFRKSNAGLYIGIPVEIIASQFLFRCGKQPKKLPISMTIIFREREIANQVTQPPFNENPFGFRIPSLPTLIDFSSLREFFEAPSKTQEEENDNISVSDL